MVFRHPGQSSFSQSAMISQPSLLFFLYKQTKRTFFVPTYADRTRTCAANPFTQAIPGKKPYLNWDGESEANSNILQAIENTNILMAQRNLSQRDCKFAFQLQVYFRRCLQVHHTRE